MLPLVANNRITNHSIAAMSISFILFLMFIAVSIKWLFFFGGGDGLDILSLNVGEHFVNIFVFWLIPRLRAEVFIHFTSGYEYVSVTGVYFVTHYF